MTSGIWYATREQVLDSLESMNTARMNRLVDAKLEAASRAVEGLLHRRFYPERRTVAFDWPNYQYANAWQIYLGDNELIALETLTSGSVVIPPSNVFLRRGDDKQEPPYTHIEVNLGTSSAFRVGSSYQQSLSVLGTFGYNDTDVSIPSGVLGGNITAAAVTLIINPSAGSYPVGVGSIMLIGTERLLLTGRRMSDTGINSSGALTDLQSANLLAVPDGTQFAQYETIIVDAERMRIDDIAGNNLIVTRAWDGSALAVHNTNADIYALRTFTAKRGALGTTAATHNVNDLVYVHAFAGLINELCIAETVVMLEQNASGYARTVGSGSNAREAAGKGLEDLRASAYSTYGRKLRSGAV